MESGYVHCTMNWGDIIAAVVGYYCGGSLVGPHWARPVCGDVEQPVEHSKASGRRDFVGETDSRGGKRCIPTSFGSGGARALLVERQCDEQNLSVTAKTIAGYALA